jgi:hypothetical protein
LRSAAAFCGDTEYFTIFDFRNFLQIIDQVTPHCPKAFFDQLNVADATKVTPVLQLFFALPNDAWHAKARNGCCADRDLVALQPANGACE